MRRRRKRVIARRRDADRAALNDRSFGRARTTFTRASTVATTDDGVRNAIDADGDGEKANRREKDCGDVDDAAVEAALAGSYRTALAAE